MKKFKIYLLKTKINLIIFINLIYIYEIDKFLYLYKNE